MDRWKAELFLHALRAEVTHLDSNTRINLELSRDPQLGWVIIQADFWSSNPDERLNNKHVRDFSFSAFEQMLADAEVEEVSTDVVDLPSVQRGSEFYEAVARQFLAYKARGEDNPIACMVARNNRPKKTVQGWVTIARKRGMLPAGRPGLAG